jgi:hypothetical protein
LTLVVTLSVGGCKTTPETTTSRSPASEWEPHLLDEFGLALELPVTWTVSATTEFAMASPRPPESDDAALVFARTVEDDPMAAVVEVLSLNAVDAGTTSKWQKTGTHRTGSCKLDGSIVMVFHLFTVEHAASTTVVMLLHDPSPSEQRRRTLDRIVASIHPIAPETI